MVLVPVCGNMVATVQIWAAWPGPAPGMVLGMIAKPCLNERYFINSPSNATATTPQ